MYPLSILRAVVDQQTRPGQRGASIVGEVKTKDGSGAAATRFLVTQRAIGIVRTGVYGRGSYWQERYG